LFEEGGAAGEAGGGGTVAAVGGAVTAVGGGAVAAVGGVEARAKPRSAIFSASNADSMLCGSLSASAFLYNYAALAGSFLA